MAILKSVRFSNRRNLSLVTLLSTGLLSLMSLSTVGCTLEAAGTTTTAPSVSSTLPMRAATGVALNDDIAVTFSEEMDPLTVTAATFTLKQGAAAIAGKVTYSGVTAIFNSTSALAANTIYTASITTGAKGLAGNALSANYEWSFTTGVALDTTPPTVLSTIPANSALGVSINRSITATFSKEMNPTTLTTVTFTVVGPSTTSLAGTVSSSGTRATFRPLANLTPNTLYHATITMGTKDLAGNALVNNFVWSFTTSASASLGPDPVLLDHAGDFVILAKSGVNTVPTSAITGNIGVSPIDSAAVTGFSLTVDASNQYATSAQVTGKVYAADYSSPTPSNLTTAVSDMETAYTDAAGRSTPGFTELGAGEIGGLVLVPGLYKWGTDVSIATDVTLNGGPNDVWIFQISGGVTQASGTRVNLTGGALPEHVFWQSFGQIMIGTTAHFEGIALCQTAIVLGTGASVNGRLLAQTAVTLDQNAVTQPSQ